MKSRIAKEGTMRKRMWCLSAGLVCGAALTGSPVARAQQPRPPIQGVTGTVALEGTIDQTSDAGRTVIVKAADGIRHLFHVTEKTVVHGTVTVGDDSLHGLEAGSRIVVHYAANAGKRTALEVDRVDTRGLKTIQGVVTRVDRVGRQLSIRLADGTTQTLRLTDRAATDVGQDVDSAEKVVIYYANDAGAQVAHYFKRVS